MSVSVMGIYPWRGRALSRSRRHGGTAARRHGGTAEWRRGDAPWVRRPPGAVILHRSQIGHAMRSLDEPLLALYAWHGDLESDLVMPLDDL